MDDLNQAVDTAVEPTPEVETPQELDIDKVDNLEQLRESYKGLKADLGTYKTTHNFVEEKFGGVQNAELAHSLYDGFVSEEFDPDKFIETISSVSPSRAKSLVEKLANQQAGSLVDTKLQELFGGKVSKDEVELFKKWKESGYMVTDEEDIPEAFKFDAEGNPLSEEQQDAYRKQFQLLREMKQQMESQVTDNKSRQQQEAEQARHNEIAQAIDSFDQENLKIIEPDFEKLGLGIKDTDTATERQQKEFVREFVIGGIGRMFLQNPELAKDYQTALKHIELGENRMARRYEPKIQKGILGIVRNGTILKMLSAILPETPEKPRPEISTSGSGSPQAKTASSTEERIQRLIASGAIKL